jgi:preprotein translocase subunit SecD
LKLSNKDRDALIFAVSNHMKFHTLLDMKNSKIAKLVNDQNWDVLVAVARADEYSRGEAFMHAGEFEKIVDKAIKIKNQFGMPVVNNQLKLVDGKHVMDLTGLKPGKSVGLVIRKVTEKIMDDGITDQKEINNIIIAMGEKYGNI